MEKITSLVNRVIETVMIILLITMVGANFWQIFTRFALNHAAGWTEEYMRYSLIWLTMLGVPYAYSKNQHIAIEFITNRFSRLGKIRDQLMIEVVILILSVFVMIIGGVMCTTNAVGQYSAALHMPMQFYYAGVPTAGVLMVFYTIPRLIHMCQELREEKRAAKEGK